MSEIGFYHLTRSGLEIALPQLLAKTLDAGQRALVVLGSDEKVAWLDDHLWTFDPASWLPHGCKKTGNPADQPIWLDTSDDNPNGAAYLFLADGGSSGRVGDFARCFELFDGHDEGAVAAARARWKAYGEAGHALTYWQQGERGWEKKAG